MKTRFLAIIISIAIVTSCCGFNMFVPYNKEIEKIDCSEYALHNKRACWISFIDMEERMADLSEEAFTNRVNEMYDVIEANNMNTVIVHVRAFCDAIYPTELFPVATFISSDRSKPSYDPLEIMLSMAHTRGLYFEAWINPYRISKDNKTTDSYKQTPYYEKYKDMMIEYTNPSGENAIILDPAREDTKQLVLNGVREIMEGYDVDAIHFDDYFYMDGMGEDLSIEEKMKNVNSMVSQVYELVKSINPDCEFGISPAGNIDNAKAQGVDVDTWMSTPGYIDYIMPQIYWSDTYKTSEGIVDMYSDRCEQWMALNKLDIPIYVGLGLYRVSENSSTDLGWANADDNLSKQYIKAIEEGYDGYAIFRYKFLNESEASVELSNLLESTRTVIKDEFVVEDVFMVGIGIISEE